MGKEQNKEQTVDKKRYETLKRRVLITFMPYSTANKKHLSFDEWHKVTTDAHEEGSVTQASVKKLMKDE